MTDPSDVDAPFSVADKVALVTGASSGLGRHFALTLARRGARVAIAARRLGRLRELADEIAGFDGRALPVSIDVTDAASVREAVDTTETELGPIAVLINNSGVAVVKPPLEQDESDWDRVVDTNLKGAWLVAQEVAKCMVKHGHGGSIINIASMLGQVTTAQLAPYAVSKAGLIHLTRVLGYELGRYKIRVNAIAPGYIETEMNTDFLMSERGQQALLAVPQRRWGKPEDLDGALLLLASQSSAF